MLEQDAREKRRTGSPVAGAELLAARQAVVQLRRFLNVAGDFYGDTPGDPFKAVHGHIDAISAFLEELQSDETRGQQGSQKYNQQQARPELHLICSRSKFSAKVKMGYGEVFTVRLS
jgi:hypothetical protein